MTKVTRLTLEQGGVLERRRLHLREISDDAEAPLDTVGADLRAARQRKGDDLTAISEVLKIRPEHLAALEEGDLSALPGRAYAIGFLRSYAEYLGLDPAAAVERFKAEIAGRGEPEAMPELFPAEAEQRKLPQGWIVFVVLLLIAVIWGGYYLSVSANRMLAQSVAPVPTTMAREAGIEQPAAPPPSPQTVAPALPATAPPPAPTTVAALPPPAVPEVLPQGNAYGLANKNSRVMLRVHRQTRVLIQGPTGTIYINRPLRPGDTYLAPNLVGLVATASDAGAIELILDGAPAGRLGQGQGAANGVSLNPQDIMDRASRAAPG